MDWKGPIESGHPRPLSIPLVLLLSPAPTLHYAKTDRYGVNTPGGEPKKKRSRSRLRSPNYENSPLEPCFNMPPGHGVTSGVFTPYEVHEHCVTAADHYTRRPG